MTIDRRAAAVMMRDHNHGHGHGPAGGRDVHGSTGVGGVHRRDEGAHVQACEVKWRDQVPHDRERDREREQPQPREHDDFLPLPKLGNVTVTWMAHFDMPAARLLREACTCNSPVDAVVDALATMPSNQMLGGGHASASAVVDHLLEELPHTRQSHGAVASHSHGLVGTQGTFAQSHAHAHAHAHANAGPRDEACVLVDGDYGRRSCSTATATATAPGRLRVMMAPRIAQRAVVAAVLRLWHTFDAGLQTKWEALLFKHMMMMHHHDDAIARMLQCLRAPAHPHPHQPATLDDDSKHACASAPAASCISRYHELGARKFSAVRELKAGAEQEWRMRTLSIMSLETKGEDRRNHGTRNAGGSGSSGDARGRHRSHGHTADGDGDGDGDGEDGTSQQQGTDAMACSQPCESPPKRQRTATGGIDPVSRHQGDTQQAHVASPHGHSDRDSDMGGAQVQETACLQQPPRAHDLKTQGSQQDAASASGCASGTPGPGPAVPQVCCIHSVSCTCTSL